MDHPKKILKPLFRLIYQPLMRLTRGQTLGVRCAVIDGAGRMLLVRHSYMPGWTFPGGGVERSETLLDALARELREEVGVVLSGTPDLHGIFANKRDFPGDHVAFYVAHDWSMPNVPKRNLEIVEQGFFHPDSVPETITASAARRVNEIFRGAKPSTEW